MIMWYVHCNSWFYIAVVVSSVFYFSISHIVLKRRVCLGIVIAVNMVVVYTIIHV